MAYQLVGSTTPVVEQEPRGVPQFMYEALEFFVEGFHRVILRFSPGEDLGLEYSKDHRRFSVHGLCVWA